jgi:hypothetical protein
MLIRGMIAFVAESMSNRAVLLEIAAAESVLCLCRCVSQTQEVEVVSADISVG